MQDSLSRDISLPAGVESMKSDMLKDVADMFESRWLDAKLAFEAEQDCKIEVKAKAALKEALVTDMRSALKELVSEATTNALREAFECFPLPMQEQMESKMQKMTCAEYDQRDKDQQDQKR